MHNILGISLGTRRVGFAIFSHGDLIRWTTHTYPGDWNIEKSRRIAKHILRYIERNDIGVLAVKIPEELRHLSIGIQQLIGAVNVLAEGKGLAVHYYSLTELKDHSSLGYCKSKRKLVEVIVQKYPDLTGMYKRGLNTGKLYYMRAIEAIACGHVCYKDQLDF